MKINGHIVLYEDPRYYSTFPSVIAQPDGELLLAFRRAPDRRLMGIREVSHSDPNSQLVLIRSVDNGRTWSPEPELLYAHPFGGCQDPCLLRLRNGTILCTSYVWCQVGREFATDDPTKIRHNDSVSLGGIILRSDDGTSWDGPFVPAPVPGSKANDLWGNPCPAFNRGSLCEDESGKIFWGVTSQYNLKPVRTSVQLMISEDEGLSWRHSCQIASDDTANFNETSLYRTLSGKLVAFIRSFNYSDRTVIARSDDGGKSFNQWENAGFQGHPHHPLRLPDNRVLLVYGYRHDPYEIRARVLDPECGNFKTAKEFVVRTGGGNWDIGYPWSTLLSDGSVLVTYYFNEDDGTRYIAGTFLSLED